MITSVPNLPREIATFLGRARHEILHGYAFGHKYRRMGWNVVAHPEEQLVSITYSRDRVNYVLTYEDIIEDIVACLNRMHKFVYRYQQDYRAESYSTR